MSIHTISWAFGLPARIGPMPKLALMVLSLYSDNDHIAVIEPTHIASECEMTLDELREALRVLLHRGLIERISDDPRVTRQTLVAYRLKGE